MKKNNKTHLEKFELLREARQFSKKISAAAAKLPGSEQDVWAQRLRRESAAAVGFVVRGFRCRYAKETPTPTAEGLKRTESTADEGRGEIIPRQLSRNVCSLGKLLRTMGKKAIESVEKIILDLNTCFAAGYSGRKETIDLKLEAYTLIRHINRYISYCSRCCQRKVNVSGVS